MKYLSDYIETKQTELFESTGAFFAFSQKQFDEKKVAGVKYASLDGGMICPTENVQTLANGLTEIHKKGIEQDLAENGKNGVIERELYNHEAFYTWDYMTTFLSLSGYGITLDEVREVFNKLASEQE